jgi:hypothetical protein
VTGLPDLTTDPRAIRVVKRPIGVPVTFARQDGVCETLEGPVGVRAGDAVLTGVQGEHWPVQRPNFLASYTPVPPTQAGQDGLYCKNPAPALAFRLDHDLAVPVGWQADPLQGHPGDWLLRYQDGSHGIVQDAVFQETYQPAPPD